MKTVLKGEIIHAVATSGGLAMVQIHEKTETQLKVAYQSVSFDTGKIGYVLPTIYKISKFGTNYNEIIKRVNNHILTHSVLLENGKTFCLDPDGTAYLFDTDGMLLWKGTLTYRDTMPTGIAVCSRHLWVAFGELNVIMRMNLNTMHEELRLGGGKESPFINPIDLYSNGDQIFVCTKEGKEILAVNTNTYSIEVYKTFERPVKQYLRSGEYEFAVLDDGIYLID